MNKHNDEIKHLLKLIKKLDDKDKNFITQLITIIKKYLYRKNKNED